MGSLHQRAKNVFLAALARPEAERVALLADVCGDDLPLREEVESLLEFHDDAEEREADRDPIEHAFVAGEVFAGRYRMIARIGSGGMGDVWRADDLVLLTEVALKVISSTTTEGRDRILNEVRLARQITHPAVCRVFDVGEVENGIFYSMELVRGEDLATLVRSVGRLPSEKVVDVGRQLCFGLAAAHAQGVLHRDLKPANVLIGDDGLVRITDFGIAVSRTDTGLHTLAGTPAYMAPEQRTAGTPLSERTDIYALGLVLYELLVGHHAVNPAEGMNSPPRPSTLVSHVNPQLERVVMRALSPNPASRPASAVQMAASLPNIGIRRDGGLALEAAPLHRRRASAWLIGTALATAVGMLAVASFFFISRRAPVLTEQDTIVLADIANTTGEPVFDGALKVALAVALEQSPFLKVFPDERVRETLRLMQRSADERVTRSIAREVAQREQLKALIVGSIGSLGRNYVITLEAINAATGDVMAREQTEASRKEQVLTSLGTAASKLREKLGESLTSIEKFDVPLARATTSSLEALQAYSLALDRGRIVARREVVPHLKRAIELDPEFALAHALLSAIYANTWQAGLAPPFAQRAFDLRDRVSGRERFFISWRYYRDATHAVDKALDLTRSWVATYPREPFAFNSYGLSAQSLGQYEQAVQRFREAIRLDPKYYAPYANLGMVLLALNRFDEAEGVVQEATDEGVDFVNIRQVSYLLASLRQDSTAMAHHLETALQTPQAFVAIDWQPRTLAFEGRLHAAHEGLRQGVQTALRADLQELASQLTMEDAELHAIVGECPETGGEVAAGLALSRDNVILERASRVLAFCGADADASRLSRELTRRFPEATLTVRLLLPVTAAALAINQREPERALELLEPVKAYDHAPSAEFWPLYLRGQAYLQLKDGQAAGAEFQSILDHRGDSPDSLLYPLALLGRARAAAMTGDIATAGTAYREVLDVWRDADANLQPFKDARKEQARLR
jgi:eukaryotic-like serine/threonine-protein kinase